MPQTNKNFHNHVVCPLCFVPSPPETWGPHDICFYCDENRAKYLVSYYRERAVVEAKFEERTQNAYKVFVALKRRVEQQVSTPARVQSARENFLTAHKKAAEYALAQKSLLYYTERRVPGYKVNWFTEDLARNIEKFYYDVVEGKHPRLILCVAARAGKSELASCSGPAWALGNFPFLRFILASYSDDLPLKFSRQIRAQLLDEEYHKIFPKGARLLRHDSAANSWSTVQGGGVKTASVTAGLLGHGCDVLVLDDIIPSATVADNPTLLENTYDWATSTAMSRLSDRSGVLVIGQRLAPLDLIGRLIKNQQEEEARLAALIQERDTLRAKSYLNEQEQEHLFFLEREVEELDRSIDRWTVVEYPALAVQDEYLTPDKKIVRVSDPREVQPDWVLLRKKGEALQPERYSREFLLKLKRANPIRFSAMYMLSPIAETGEFFNPEDFQRYDPVSITPYLSSMHVYCAFDLAISTKASADYTAGVAIAVDADGNYYVLDIVRGRYGDLDLIADIIIDFHLRWNAVVTGVEKSALELALAPIIRRKMQERKQFIYLAEGKDALKPISDKKVRARGLQAIAKSGKLHIPDSGGIWDEFVAELTTFPVGAHDDMVDAASYAVILQSRYGLPQKVEVPTTTTYRLRYDFDKYDSTIEEQYGYLMA